MVGFQAVFCLVNIPLPLFIMRVKAVFSGTSARKMLDSHGNAVCCYALFTSLYTGNQTLQNLTDKLGIFPEGSVSSLPSGVCHTVCHVHIAFLHTNCIPLSSDTGRKIVNEFCTCTFYGSCKSQSSRPCCKDTGSIIHTENHLTVFISGVGNNQDWQEMLALLCHAVHLINPVCQFVRLRISS